MRYGTSGEKLAAYNIEAMLALMREADDSEDTVPTGAVRVRRKVTESLQRESTFVLVELDFRAV